MGQILYYSTNKGAETTSLKEAILRGQAPDRGLYMPESIPNFEENELEGLKGKEYSEIAFSVLRKFLDGEIEEEKVRKICKSAYNFEVPVEEVYGGNYVARMDRGPTASFKDFAARMLARVMQEFLAQDGRNITILTATSGDTGGAVAHAFQGLENVKVVVLFPKEEISDIQRKQMTTLGENVKAIAVEGKFDDCQAMVKACFADPGLGHCSLSSANSINFGRLMPQSVYYTYSHAQVADAQEEIVFSVPSGNFGNLMGGIIAKEMGLPVKRFVVATNENDEFPKFLNSGDYEKICPSKNCISNAMNVGHPSNLARLVDFYSGQMDEKGNLGEKPDLEKMRKDLYAYSVSDSETRGTIKGFYEKYNAVLEPHGAVGWAALEKYVSDEDYKGKAVCFETADPAKFPEEIEKILGFSPEIPLHLKELEGKKEDFIEMGSNPGELKGFLKGFC